MTELKLITAMVLSTILLDGRRVFPGDEDEAVIVELKPQDFEELSALGCVVEVDEIVEVDNDDLPDDQKTAAEAALKNPQAGGDEKEDKSGTDTGGKDAPTSPPTIDDIVAAIGSLTKEQFTQSGSPEVKALEAALKAEITAAQRDLAWTKYQAEKENSE